MSIFKAKFVNVQYKNSNIKKKISKVFYKSSRNYFVSPWIEISWTKAKNWKNERIVEFQGSNKANFSCHNCTLKIYERFVNFIKTFEKNECLRGRGSASRIFLPNLTLNIGRTTKSYTYLHRKLWMQQWTNGATI